MKALSDILGKRDFRKVQALDDKTIFFVFRKVIRAEFGNVGAEKFIPDYFANKTLFVKAESAVWSTELWTNRGKITMLINREIGDEVVERIKMK